MLACRNSSNGVPARFLGYTLKLNAYFAYNCLFCYIECVVYCIMEAVGKLEICGKIDINAAMFQEYMVLSIGNTMQEVESTRPHTTKEDKLFHGLGLKM